MRSSRPVLIQDGRKKNMKALREDSQIDFVTGNVPWTFGGGGVRGICPGLFLVTNKHRLLCSQNLQ